MAVVKTMCSCTIFLLLLLSNGPLHAQGRRLLRRKQKVCKRCPVQDGQTGQEIGRGTFAVLTGDSTRRTLLVEDNQDFRPTAPGHSPGVGHLLRDESARKDANTDSHTLSEDTQGFRPTAPGHSPGVGHVLNQKDANNAGRTISADLQDSKPTMPGHSPGVGHSFESQGKEEGVHSHSVGEAEGSSTVDKQDFRPTEPGHSPGIGHSFRNKGT